VKERGEREENKERLTRRRRKKRKRRRRVWQAVLKRWEEMQQGEGRVRIPRSLQKEVCGTDLLTRFFFDIF
jgi:hypothetical protein